MRRTYPVLPPWALLSAAAEGDVSVFALFCDQGTNKVYFDKLQSFYKSSVPLHHYQRYPQASYIHKQAAPFYPHGLDVVSGLWIPHLSPQLHTWPPFPSHSLLSTSCLQPVQYLIVGHVSGLTPQELHDHISGPSTGQSSSPTYQSNQYPPMNSRRVSLSAQLPTSVRNHGSSCTLWACHEFEEGWGTERGRDAVLAIETCLLHGRQCPLPIGALGVTEKLCEEDLEG